MIKKKKQVLSILMILVLLVMNIPVFGNSIDSQKTAGDILKEYGLLEGNEQGDLMEDNELTRAELIVIISQLKGVKNDAENFYHLGQFSDIEGSEWYAPYISYAEVEGWTNGYPDGTFKPEATVSSQELSKFMLNVLGYKDIPWENTMEASEEYGITSSATNKQIIKRGESFDVMLNTLNAEVADSGKKLGDELGIDEYISGQTEDDESDDDIDFGDVTVHLESVIALTDELIEVTLDSDEEKPGVLGRDMFKISDSDSESVDITSIDFAEWDEDGYKILIGTDTLEDNKVYTLTTKDEEKTFRGIEVNEDEVNLVNAFSTKYNKVLLTFDKPMTTNLDIEIEEKYNDNDELYVEDILYGNNPYEIEIETSEQSSGTLYELIVREGEDLFNIEFDDIEQSFSGKDKPDGDLQINTVVAEDFETVIVTFKDNMEVEERSIDIDEFTIEGMYTEDTVEVFEAKLLTDSSEYTMAEESNEDSAIVLTVSDLEKSTLYQLTIDDLESIYDTEMDTDYNEKTFVGLNKPDEDFSYTVDAVGNTTVRVTFDNKVTESALTLDNYTIESKYFDDAVDIFSIIKENDKVYELEVSELDNSLYELTVENIEDLYGNDIDSDEDTQTFVGRDKEDGVSKITDITRTSDTKLEVTFDRELYKDDAQNISNYIINNDIGYPIVAKLLSDLKTVELTIPKTEEGVLYKVAATDLRNTDKVDMEESKVEGTFTGKGLSKSLPKIDGVIAEDAYTLKIYFDKDVSSDQIEGVLWNSDTNQLLGRIEFKEEDDNSYISTLASIGQEYVEAFNDNTLRITYPTKEFDELSSNETYFIKVSDTYIDGDENEKEFAGSSEEKEGPKIEAAQGLDKRSVLIYATEDLNLTSLTNALGEITVERTGYSENPTNAYKSGTNQYILIMPRDMEDAVYTLKISQEAADGDGLLDITDANGQFELYDQLDNDSSYAVEVDFAGVSTDTDSVIDDVDAISLDNRTIKVYFNDVLELDNSVTDPTKYNLITENDLPYTTFTNSLSPDYVEYDSDKKTATLYYTQDIGTESNLARYIVFDNQNEIVDKSGFRKVEEANGDILKVQYALRTDKPESPEVVSAKLSDGGFIVTLDFNESVTYTDNINSITFDTDDTIEYYEFENLNTDTSKTYQTTDLANWFNISGTLDTGGSLDIFKVERISDTEVEIYLNGKAEPASKISISSNSTGIYDIVNRTNTSITPDNDSENELDIEIAVPYSLGSGVDYLPPTGYDFTFDDVAINSHNETAPTLTFSGAEVGATYNYTISDGSNPDITGSGTITAADEQITLSDLSGLDDTTLTATIYLEDADNNAGSDVTKTIVKDTIVPNGYTVAIDQDPVTPGNETTLSFTFTSAIVDTTYNYIISDGVNTDITGTGTITASGEQITDIDVSGLDDGDLTLSAELIDEAGNVGVSATDTTTKFTEVTSGYDFTIDQSVINSSNENALSFTLSDAEIGASYHYSIDDGVNTALTGTAVISASDEQITGIDVSDLDDTTLDFDLYLSNTNGNGNTISKTIEKDTIAPSGYTISIDQSFANIANENTMSFTFDSAETGATYNYTISDGVSTDVTGTGTISTATDQITGIDVSSLNEGTITFDVELVDVAGNTGSTASDTVEKDTIAPTLDTVTIASNTPGFSDVASTGDDVTLSITSNEDITNVSGDFEGNTGTLDDLSDADETTFEITLGLPSSITEGVIPFTIDAEDLAGNPLTQVTATTDGSEVVFDDSAPVLTDVSTADTDNDGKIEFTLTFDDDIDDSKVDFTGFDIVDDDSTSLTGTGATANDNIYILESDTVDTADMDLVYNSSNGNLQNKVGLELADGTYTDSTDTVAPILVSATLTDVGGLGTDYDAVGDEIDFVFSEIVNLISDDLAGLEDLIGTGADGETPLNLTGDTVSGFGTTTITVTEVGGDDSITGPTEFNVINANSATDGNTNTPVDNIAAPTLN